jgi:hypothetical protein
MSQEFTLLIASCGPIRDNRSLKFESAEIIMSWGAGTSATIRPPLEKCLCDCPSKLKFPPPPYDLTKCPSESEQEDVFAWDCETSYEAEDEGEALAHDNAVRPKNNQFFRYPERPPWVKGCKKCKCPINAPLTIDWSYDDGGKCGGGHQCDRAVFDFGFLRGELAPDTEGSLSGRISGGDGAAISLGTFNLNNKSSGGPVKSPRVKVSEDQITNALFKDENGNTCISMYVRCALDNCHQGISHCVMKDSAGATLIDQCFDIGSTKVILCKAPETN